MRKFIVEHTFGDNGGVATNGIIIPTHYGDSLKCYKELAEVARESFPDLSDKDMRCSRVIKSDYCYGMILIRFPLPVGTRCEGWHFCNHLSDVEYV